MRKQSDRMEYRRKMTCMEGRERGRGKMKNKVKRQ